MSWKCGTLLHIAVVEGWHSQLVYWLVVLYFQGTGLLKGVPQYVFCIEHNLAFLILAASLLRNFGNRINTAVVLCWIFDQKKLVLLFINRIFQAKESTILLTCLQPNLSQGCQQLPYAHPILPCLYISGQAGHLYFFGFMISLGSYHQGTVEFWIAWALLHCPSTRKTSQWLEFPP